MIGILGNCNFHELDATKSAHQGVASVGIMDVHGCPGPSRFETISDRFKLTEVATEPLDTVDTESLKGLLSTPLANFNAVNLGMPASHLEECVKLQDAYQ